MRFFIPLLAFATSACASTSVADLSLCADQDELEGVPFTVTVNLGGGLTTLYAQWTYGSCPATDPCCHDAAYLPSVTCAGTPEIAFVPRAINDDDMEELFHAWTIPGTAGNPGSECGPTEPSSVGWIEATGTLSEAVASRDEERGLIRYFDTDEHRPAEPPGPFDM